jgi:tetratricopeptide (TPR) repeat protein
MPQRNDLFVLEIAVEDFDLSLIPERTRKPGSKEFEVAVKHFYEEQLRKVAVGYSVSIEGGKIRATWRKDTLLPDSLDEAIAALQKGDYGSGVQILEFLLPSRQEDAAVHYNLGMAYSDLGKLDKAVEHLLQAVRLDRGMVNARVALGVAHSRLKDYAKAASVLKDAVLDDPDNGYALRNLGAVLLQLGPDQQDALRYLTRAVEVLPTDQQSWFGLAQAQSESGDDDAADASLRRVIELQPYSPIADMAKQIRSRIAQKGFRKAAGGGVLRMDAVMYCLGAMKKFATMTADQVKNVGFEIATLGMNGINVNDPKGEYHLRTLPGTFTGLQLLCYEYVAFKQIAPELDIGFDVSKEFAEAQRMKEMGL